MQNPAAAMRARSRFGCRATDVPGISAIGNPFRGWFADGVEAGAERAVRRISHATARERAVGAVKERLPGNAYALCMQARSGSLKPAVQNGFSTTATGRALRSMERCKFSTEIVRGR